MRGARCLLHVSCLAMLIAGCGNEGKAVPRADATAQAKESAFREKVECLALSLDGRESLVRRSAYGLCREIRQEPDVAVRLRLAALYANAIHDMSVDISPDYLDDEKGLNGIDIRLRNSWHLVEWGTATLFDSEPGSLNGWTFLISAVGRYRDVLAMIEKKLSQDSLDARWRMRLSAFKRHVSMMNESKIWELGKTYWSLRHKMTIRQREEIRHEVKRMLGVLPSEMARDEETTSRLGRDPMSAEKQTSRPAGH